VRLDLWRLTTIFLSDQKFSEWEHNSGDKAVADLREFEEDEITRILITSAIAVRIVDDRDGPFVDDHTDPCGTLIRDFNQAEEVPLSLREACNKIVHAHRINFDVEGDYRDGPTYLNPTMYLYGELGGRPWKAVLRVLDYAKEASRTI